MSSNRGVHDIPTPDARTRYSSTREDPLDLLAWPEFSDENRQLLEAVGQVLEPEPGTLLWDSGEAYDLYLVLAGGVALIDQRDERIAFMVEPGDFVGELGMLMDQPAFLAGTALPGSRLLRVPVRDLCQVMATSVELGDVLLAALDARRRLLSRWGEGGLVLAGDEGPDLDTMVQFAERNHVPYRTVLRSDQVAWSGLAAGCDLPARGTAVVSGGRRVLVRPSTRDLAAAVGLDLGALDADQRCDLLVVGAGPAGLAAAVYGSSEGLDVVVVEDVALGGQAGTSSRIENYLGFPGGIAGTELARAAMLQAVKFGARLVSPRSITGLSRVDGGLTVRLDDESDVSARAVVAASGVHYRRLDVPGLADYEGRGVFYAATELEARACIGRSAVVVGGANSAGQAALFLTQKAEHVHLIVRRAELTDTMSDYLTRRIAHHRRITVHPRAELSLVEGGDRLGRVAWRDRESGAVTSVEAGGLFVMIGAVPRTSWLRDSGVELDDKGFVVTGAGFATSLPGLFAVGDVRSGSVKRVASAVGEGSVVVSAVHAHLAREQNR